MSLLGDIFGFVTSAFELGDLLPGGEGHKAHEENLAEIRKARDFAKWQEVDALGRGNQDAGQLRMQGTALEGKQRTTYALGGIDSTSGTAAATMASSRIMSELDSLMVLNNARREALGHRRTQEALDHKTREEIRGYNERVKNARMKGIGALLKMGDSAVQTGMSFGGGGG